MHNINIYSGSNNSIIETKCTTEVSYDPTISDKKIPKIGILFESFEKAPQLYYNYANKVGFEPHIRNTNLDKHGMISINQSIQCNRDGYQIKKNLAT
ncbi:hypothetical protein Ahy_B02g059216 [Arachis hypogaea]|uniref:FAR1 domain-containing protein n=1 Tax=Arachis hypogaea TaxID=3818 RepID=A0A445AGA7_ARAHY|nr:hypothetical protein Ahy_B02g059216 [Arachis hypogaea]